MKKRILAAVIAAVFAVLNVASALPVFALNESTTRYPTPEGYNDHDYQKLVAFLEQTDDEGVKNGEKLSDNYDPNDPTTWGSYLFEWIESDGELRIQIIDVRWRRLCGTLDVSGCTALEQLRCNNNNLTELDVSGCTALTSLYCGANYLTEIVLEGTELYDEDAGEVHSFELIKSGGNGFVGIDDAHGEGDIYRIVATPCEGYEFLGWYNEVDEPVISADECFHWSGYAIDYTWFHYCSGIGEEVLIAKFSKVGDVDGYYEHDYQKVVAFLEQTDENGVKNGEKLNENYDPADPETWEIEDSWGGEHTRFNWIAVDGKLRLFSVNVGCGNYGKYHESLCGTLDLSDCTALRKVYCGLKTYYEDYDEGYTTNNISEINISGCTALKYLDCSYNSLTELEVNDNAALTYLDCGSNELTELDVSHNTALTYFNCRRNNLSELDLSSNTALTYLKCSDNNLTELDVSNQPELKSLICEGNKLTELDTSNCPELKFDCFKSYGNGTIGVYIKPFNHFVYFDEDHWVENETFCAVVYAYPNEGADFLGWYNEAGELIVSVDDCSYDDGQYSWLYDGNNDPDETVLIAKFTEAEPIPGDADGDGELTSDDVLLLMRAVMELEELTDEMLANCDMNGDGVVNFTDALIMLRMVLDMLPNTVAY